MGLVQLMEPTNGTFEVIASLGKKERKEQTGAHSFSFYRSGSKMELSTIYLCIPQNLQHI
jgi:hypothetical protein